MFLGGFFTSTGNQSVSFVACQAVAALIEAGALIRNRYTDIATVKDPVFGTFNANLTIPIPGGTSKIANFLFSSSLTLSIDQIVSFEACKTVSTDIESITLIRDRNADTKTIEDPVGRALKTSRLIPVPESTAKVRYFLLRNPLTLTRYNSISLIAGQAISIGIEGIALI